MTVSALLAAEMAPLRRYRMSYGNDIAITVPPRRIDRRHRCDHVHALFAGSGRGETREHLKVRIGH